MTYALKADFLKKLYKNTTFLGIFVSILVEGYEDKYSIKLDRSKNWLFIWSEGIKTNLTLT